jgi:tRNA 2-thiouridine synthesizing protein C
MKKILFILTKAPYADSVAREALDVILAAASFENNFITLLFLDDGLFQLCDKQNAAELGVKPLADMLAALPLYGIEAIYAVEKHIEVRGLKCSELILPVKLLNTRQVTDLLSTADVLFSF